MKEKNSLSKRGFWAFISHLSASFKKSHRTKKISVINLTLTGVLLGLTILTNFLGSFMQFYGFLKFDLSLIFVFIAFFFLGWFSGTIVILTRFIIGPWILPGDFIAATYFGHFILLITHMFYMCIFAITYSLLKNVLFKKINAKNHDFNNSNGEQITIDIKHFFLRYSVVFAASIIGTTIIISALDVFVLVPAYFWILVKLGVFPSNQTSASLSAIIEEYNSNPIYRSFFFFIPNYFAGGFTLFISFNLANLSVNSIIIAILLLTDYKTGLFSRLQNETRHRY